MKVISPDKFVAGLAFGCVIGLTVAWSIDSEIFSGMKPEFLAASATILAGGMAIWVGQKQIAEQRKDQKNQRLARLRAARAVLPQVLSNLHALCVYGLSLQSQVDVLRRNRDEALTAVKCLTVAPDQLETIKECIEFGDDASIAWLSLILAHFQIEVARLNSLLLGPKAFGHIFESSQIDWEFIASMIDHLFEFSRTGQPPGDTLSPTAGLTFQLAWHQTPQFTAAWARRIDYLESNGGLSYAAFQKRLT